MIGLEKEKPDRFFLRDPAPFTNPPPLGNRLFHAMLSPVTSRKAARRGNRDPALNAESLFQRAIPGLTPNLPKTCGTSSRYHL
jgi:hypothetical protein